MLRINDYIKERLDSGELMREIAEDIGISVSMVSSYAANTGYNCSINLAKVLYTKYSLVMHPFSEESLKYEIEKRENGI